MESKLEHISNIVTNEENLALTQPILETKIFTTIWSLAPDKALGPDGFTISFYRHYWDLIKHDLKRMLLYVQRSLRLGGNTNSSFLA